MMLSKVGKFVDGASGTLVVGTARTGMEELGIDVEGAGVGGGEDFVGADVGANVGCPNISTTTSAYAGAWSTLMDFTVSFKS
jgi:hypothetical protein